jgi:hypothetical protein
VPVNVLRLHDFRDIKPISIKRSQIYFRPHVRIVVNFSANIFHVCL